MTVKEIGNNIKQNKICYICIAPFFLLFFIFTVLPVASSIVLGFTYYNILESPVFTGLSNYAKLFFSDEIFMKSVMNTMVMALVIGPGGYLMALLLAWMVNELSPRMRTLMVLLIYAPSISGNMFVIWGLIFSGDAYGYINGFLINTGFIKEPVLWFHDVRYMMTLVIVISLWMGMGSGFLSFIAGFSGLDRSLFEAATMDGVQNRWQELWYITLPQMRPQMLFGAVMSITAAFGVGSVGAALCGMPSTDYAVHTVLNHITDYGTTRFDMGYSAAMSTVLFLAMIVCNAFIRKLLASVGK